MTEPCTGGVITIPLFHAFVSKSEMVLHETYDLFTRYKERTHNLTSCQRVFSAQRDSDLTVIVDMLNSVGLLHTWC